MGKNLEGKLVVFLDEVGIEDIPYVGGKNASLGEMIQHLKPKGVNVPYGFVVTAEAYRYFIRHNNLEEKIKDILKDLDPSNIEQLTKKGHEVRELIRAGDFPKDLEDEIAKAYDKLSEMYNTHAVDVAVRSSATAEDLPDASFAGQQETYLNVVGAQNVLVAVKNGFASLFTDRAISYRHSHGFDHFKIAISMGVQKMVRSDLGASGVMFTIDTESGFKDVVVINAIYGLGEMIVQGMVTPDEYMVFKPTLKKGFSAIIEKKLGKKDRKMIYGAGSDRVKIVNVPQNEQKLYALNDDEILTLAKWGIEIEEHYKKPMDIEWAKDGNDNQLYIVQARPETVQSRRQHNKIVVYEIKDPLEDRLKHRILSGIAVGDKIAVGTVKVIHSIKEAADFKEGDILVTDITDPDWEPIMKKAAGIITNRGGRTAHAAIVAREFGVPAAVGTQKATEVLKTGMRITLSCAEGETAFIYDKELNFEAKEIDLSNIKKPKTKMMINVADPSSVFRYAAIPNDGVGLAREEFIIANYIKIHPLALININYVKEKDPELYKEIENITFGYDNKEEYYVKKLSYGIAKIAAAFYPNPVIVRFSDFKSNEYAGLLGGKYFEPKEENPMIGWRGASRYYSDKFKVAFGLECKAILRVRNKMGLDNVKVMIPFCRTPKEGEKVLETMKEFGLVRGENNLEVYVMAEIPSNVILAEEYAKIFDGFSIGSNDLTQLTLGIDRDSDLVAHLYDERNEAVKIMVANLIDVAKKTGRKVGICGQAPSDFPDFAQFLVEKGIDSISLNPDSFFKTMLAVVEMEEKLGK